MQDGPLHIRMKMDFRFIDGRNEWQPAPSFFIDNQIVLNGHGLAMAHDINLGNQFQRHKGNELHVIRQGPVLTPEQTG